MSPSQQDRQSLIEGIVIEVKIVDTVTLESWDRYCVRKWLRLFMGEAVVTR
jgi:hypothetical protein